MAWLGGRRKREAGMNIELLVEDTKTGNIWDLSSVASDITYTTYLQDSPGKLSFSIVEDVEKMFYEGSRVRLTVDGKGVFFGYVFTRSRTEAGSMSVDCYDQLRYLKNKDTAVFSGVSAHMVFAQICKAQQLEHRVVSQSRYLLPSKVYDDKSFYEMIQDSIDLTLVNSGAWFLMRDNFGVIEFAEIGARQTNFIIGDGHLLTGYSFKSSIDDDTYNQIKLVQEVTNDETNVTSRQVYFVYDSATMAQWGALQYYETVDENTNEAQIRQRAEMLLELKNRPKQTLTLNCLGNLEITAGNSVYVDIEALRGEETENGKYALVSECQHTFSNSMHTMSLKIEVV